MKRVINFVKGRRDDRRDHKFVNSPICVEITNPAGQKIQSEDEHILGLQSGYGYQIDVNGKDKNMTKLHKAAWQGNLDKVKIHLKKADVNSVDHSNRTALHFAVAQGHSNVAFFLLGAKAIFDLRDSDGMTPFLKAVECGNKECVNILLEQGADVNIVDRNGNTGLHLSSKLGFLNISSLLLMKGANINISNNVGEFPLHLATEGEHREVVALLLCSGAQVNVIDRDNRTPLMLAARFGHTSLVSLLLEHGASLEACDSNGWTAEDYALIGGHQQLAQDLKAPAREQLCKEMEDAVLNGSSPDEIKEEKTADDRGKDVCSDESEASQPAIVHETAVVQINSHLIESNNGNNDFQDRAIQEEEDDEVEIGNEEREDKKEEGETVESPRSCVTPPPLQPPRSWDLIQAGMIDEKEVQRRSLTTLGTLRSRRESFNENSNTNNNNNGGSSPNQANDDLEKITDIVKTVQMEGLVDDESSDGEENLPLDRTASVRRVKAATLERTPSLDLTLTEEDLTKSKESQGCRASSDGGTLGREDTLQGYEEIWEKNANISEEVDNKTSENNNKLQHSSVVNDDSGEVFDTGQLTTDITEQLVQRNREINTAVGYVTNEIYRIMIEKNEYQSDGADKVINQTVHTSSSLDNLDERKPRFIEIESSRSCDNLDNRYMTLEEKLCSGIYSAETLDTDPSINDNEGTQSLDNLDESPVGTVIKRNMHREVQSLDTLDDYDQCCSRGCVEARPIKKHSRNKSVSVGQHGWSKSVDVLTKPSNIDRIQIDTKKIDAQLECYDEALRELAQVELLKRNSSERSSGESSSGRRNGSSSSSVEDKKPCFPPPPPVLTGDIPYFSEIVSSSSQKNREYFMKPKDESDFSINQDYSPLPKIFDKSGSVDGLLDSDRISTTVENTSISGSFKSDSRFIQSTIEDDSLFNHDLPPPPPIDTASNMHNEMFETDLYLNLEKPPANLENDNVVINVKINGIKPKNDDAIDTDSESKRAREVENNLYKLEKDLFNINMSTIMKPRTTDVNQNGIVHQDIVVANGEMPPFDMRSKVFEKGVKQTSFAVFDEARSGVVKREDSSSPVDRSAAEDSPKVPPRYKRSLRKGKSESEVFKLSDGKSSKSRSKSASMYSEVEALFEKPSKGRKKSGGSGEIQEKSESDSELCERPLRRKRKMLLAMRGVVAGSKDSDDDDDTSTGDPPFWLSTDKGGHFARQDTVLASQPTRILEKSQDPPGCVGASQSGEKPPDLDKDWTSSDADTASGSDEVVVGNAFSLGSHHKLLKEHLRQATNEKTVLEEAVAVLREREERLQYELADARQALSAREDTVLILQEQARRVESRYSIVLDEVQTLRHAVSSSELELKHLRQLCDKLAMEKAEALDELNRLRGDSTTEQCDAGAERKKTNCEAKPEQMQLLQRQKLEAERRNEVLVNHLEEAMRQCESSKTEKDALARQNITDIKKLQQDTLLWKERYEDCLGRLERIEAECQPRLFDAQRTIDMLRTSIKQLEAEKELNQDNWKTKVMDEVISRIKRAMSTNNLVPKANHDKKSACFENCMKRQGYKNKKCIFKFCDCTGVSNSEKNNGCDRKCKRSDKFYFICDAPKKNIPNDLDKDNYSKCSLLLDHNRKLLKNLILAKKDKESISDELCRIRRNIECDSKRQDCCSSLSPNESFDKSNSDKDIQSDNQLDLMKIERKYQSLSKVKSILSIEEVEIESIHRSIQEVGKDIESIMNNLYSQIVLVKTLNQSENSESENLSNEISSQNSSKTRSSNGESYSDGREMRLLVRELVDIRRDLSYLHGESERVKQQLKFIVNEKRNGDAMSDKLKSTTECIQSCNTEIVKLNSLVIQLNKIIQTLMIEFDKKVCQCSSDHPKDCDNNNEKYVKNEMKPDSNQNRLKTSSKQTDSNQVDGKNSSKLYDQNVDPLFLQESIKQIYVRSDLKSKLNDDHKREKATREGSSSQVSITDNHCNKSTYSKLKNSNKFADIRQKCQYDSHSFQFTPQAPPSNNDTIQQSLSTVCLTISDNQVFGSKKYLEEEYVVMDEESVQYILHYDENDIIFQRFDQSLVVESSKSVLGMILKEDSWIDCSRRSKADSQSSSQKVIYLKKALTIDSSKGSNQSGVSQDLEQSATNSEIVVYDNTTNSCYESVTDRDTEQLDPLSSLQTVTLETTYVSEPAYTLKNYCESYPSSTDFDNVNYLQNITTESVPDGFKSCKRKQQSDDKQKLEKNDCDKRIEITEVESNKIVYVSCQNRQEELNLEQESIFTISESLPRQEVVDNKEKCNVGKENYCSNEGNSTHVLEPTDELNKIMENDVTHDGDRVENIDPIELPGQKLTTIHQAGITSERLSTKCITELIHATSESKSEGEHNQIECRGSKVTVLHEFDDQNSFHFLDTHPTSNSNQESNYTNTDLTMSIDQKKEAKDSCLSSCELNTVHDTLQQSITNSEGVVSSKEDNLVSKGNKDVPDNLNVQHSKISVVQTKESPRDLEECRTHLVVSKKTQLNIRGINRKIEFIINNDTLDQNLPKENCAAELSKSNCTITYQAMQNNSELEKDKDSYSPDSSKLNAIIEKQSETKAVPRENDNNYCAVSNHLNAQQTNISVGVQTINYVEESKTSLVSLDLQSHKFTVEKPQVTTRKINRRTEFLNNKIRTSAPNYSEPIKTPFSKSNSELKQSRSVCVCSCYNCSECTLKQNSNDKANKSCFKLLSNYWKKQSAASPRSNDEQINFLFDDLNFDTNIFSRKFIFKKLLPVEKSLGLYFRRNSSDAYSLDDFVSNLKLSDWRLNPFLGERMTDELFDGDVSLLSSENPLDEYGKLSHFPIYADLKRPILLPQINLSSVTCKADTSKDVITDIGQKLSTAQSTVDCTLQAAASTSNLLNQEDDAIRLDFQQVENLECPDSFDTTKIDIVNDLNRTNNGFQECEQQQQQPVSKTSLNRERQEMAVGRMRQQALLESENNLSAKIAEINSVLHQQLVEQDRRRAHNEMQMKKEFELTRQKLLMELSKVQTALKAKEAEEKVLREKYEKLSRDVEKTAEIKRKQLIEKSYSLNLAHPATMWEKELSIKRNVVQTPLPPPPPPPPLPPPDIPSSFSTDDRFSHLSLRAQLHQSITKHRTNPRNGTDQVNLATNCNSQFEEVASGFNSGNSVVPSTSSNIKR